MTTEEQKYSTDQAALDEVFPRNPLQSVACEVRFASKLGVVARIDEVQEYLAPYYGEVGREELSSQSAPTVITYVFSNAATGRAIKVTENRFAVVETKYTSFEEFVGEVLKLVRWLTGKFKIEELSRVGLRYVNQIRVPQVDGKFRLTDYVRPYIDLSGFRAGAPGGFGLEVGTRNEDCYLFVRSLLHQQLPEALYVFDYDAFVGDPNQSESVLTPVENIEPLLNVLHRYIQLEFLSHVTEDFKRIMRSTK